MLMLFEKLGYYSFLPARRYASTGTSYAITCTSYASTGTSYASTCTSYASTGTSYGPVSVSVCMSQVGVLSKRLGELGCFLGWILGPSFDLSYRVL